MVIGTKEKLIRDAKMEHFLQTSEVVLKNVKKVSWERLDQELLRLKSEVRGFARFPMV